MHEDEGKDAFIKRLGITMTYEWSDYRIPFTRNTGTVWKCTLKRPGHVCILYYGTGPNFPESLLTPAHLLQYMAECEYDTLYDARENWYAICTTAEDRRGADRYLTWFQAAWQRFEHFFGEHWTDYRNIYLQ